MSKKTIAKNKAHLRVAGEKYLLDGEQYWYRVPKATEEGGAYQWNPISQHTIVLDNGAEILKHIGVMDRTKCPLVDKAMTSTDGEQPPPYQQMCKDREATIAAHEKTIADLEAKVKDLSQWPALAQQIAQNNTRLTTTVDNMAKAAAGLVPVPNQVMSPR